MAAQELGLGTAMHSQVPRSITALPVLEACMRWVQARCSGGEQGVGQGAGLSKGQALARALGVHVLVA